MWRVFDIAAGILAVISIPVGIYGLVRRDCTGSAIASGAGVGLFHAGWMTFVNHRERIAGKTAGLVVMSIGAVGYAAFGMFATIYGSFKSGTCLGLCMLVAGCTFWTIAALNIMVAIALCGVIMLNPPDFPSDR